jgi:hypothetical protein
MTILRVTTLITGNLVSGGGINTMYFDAAGGGAGDAATAVGDFWGDFLTYLSDDVTFTVQPEVEEVNEVNGAVTGVVAVTGSATTGPSAAEWLPPAMQALVRFRTGEFVDGREIRGRVFIPGFVETINDNGAPAAALLTQLQTAANTLITDSADMVIWQRPREARGVIPPGPGHPNGLPAQDQRDGSFARVTTASVWSKWAILRSRRD